VKIIYTASDGSVCVIIPAINSGLTIEQIAAKDVPEGLTSYIVEDSAVLGNRYFRNAWKITSKKVAVDMTKAKEIKKNYLRAERAPLLEKLDTDFMIAIEDDDTTAQASIKDKKQQLRDVTTETGLNASTPEALEAFRPTIFDEV